jgi:hypothetical protein
MKIEAAGFSESLVDFITLYGVKQKRVELFSYGHGNLTLVETEVSDNGVLRAELDLRGRNNESLERTA